MLAARKAVRRASSSVTLRTIRSQWHTRPFSLIESSASQSGGFVRFNSLGFGVRAASSTAVVGNKYSNDSSTTGVEQESASGGRKNRFTGAGSTRKGRSRIELSPEEAAKRHLEWDPSTKHPKDVGRRPKPLGLRRERAFLAKNARTRGQQKLLLRMPEYLPPGGTRDAVAKLVQVWVTSVDTQTISADALREAEAAYDEFISGIASVIGRGTVGKQQATHAKSDSKSHPRSSSSTNSHPESTDGMEAKGATAIVDNFTHVLGRTMVQLYFLRRVDEPQVFLRALSVTEDFVKLNLKGPDRETAAMLLSWYLNTGPGTQHGVKEYHGAIDVADWGENRLDIQRRLNVVFHYLAGTGRLPEDRGLHELVCSEFMRLTVTLHNARQTEAIDDVFEMWKVMQRRGSRTPYRAFTTLIAACAKFAHPSSTSRAFLVLETMEALGVHANVKHYNNLARSVIHSAPTNPYKAIEVAEIIYGKIVTNPMLKIELKTLNILIHLCAKADARPFQAPTDDSNKSSVKDPGADLAFKFYRKLVDEHGLTPDDFTFGALLTAQVRQPTTAVSIDRAFKVFKEMKRYRHRPNLIHHNILFSAISNSKDPATVERALGIYKEMLDSDDSISPDGYTYTSLLTACANIKDDKLLEVGKRLIADMQELGIKPTLVIYNAMIKVHASVPNPDAIRHAFSTLEELLAAGFTPDNVTYSSVIHAALMSTISNQESGVEPSYSHPVCGRSVVDIAVYLYNDMLARNIVPNAPVYSTLLHLCAVSKLPGAFERAIQFIDAMSRVNVVLDSAYYSRLAWLSADSRDPQALEFSFRLFDQILHDHKRPARVVFQHLINLCASQSASDPSVLDRAFTTFELLYEHGHIPNESILAGMVRGCRVALGVDGIDKAMSVYEIVRAKEIEGRHTDSDVPKERETYGKFARLTLDHVLSYFPEIPEEVLQEKVKAVVQRDALAGK